MIQVIPSISVIEGKCVRLLQRDYNRPVAYEESPIDIAKRFEDHGITKIHLIDLEGAKEGRVINFDILEMIAGHTDLEINFGGGVNTDGDFGKVMEYGAKQVTVGSLAMNDPDLFSDWIISYGKEKLMLSAMSDQRIIKIRGGFKPTNKDLFDHINDFYMKSVQYIKVTEVSKDGMLEGPDIELYADLLQRFPDMKLIASGGIRNIDDFKTLNDMGVYGVVFGKAYYENKITLKELDQFMATAL